MLLICLRWLDIYGYREFRVSEIIIIYQGGRNLILNLVFEAWSMKVLNLQNYHLNKVNVTYYIFPQIDLQIQHKSYQNTSGLHCSNWQTNPKINVEIQGTQKNQNNSQKEQSWETHIFQFPNLLQSYSNQDSVVLSCDRSNIGIVLSVQKQIPTSMFNWFSTKVPRSQMGERNSFQQIKNHHVFQQFHS